MNNAETKHAAHLNAALSIAFSPFLTLPPQSMIRRNSGLPHMTYPLTAAKHCDRFRGIAGTSTVCSGKDSTAPRHQDLLAVQLARKLHPTQTACQDKTTVTICRTPWFRHPSKL